MEGKKKEVRFFLSFFCLQTVVDIITWERLAEFEHQEKKSTKHRSGSEREGERKWRNYQ